MTTPLPQNPFPGMNPYLERSDIWPGVHFLTIAGLQGFLAERLWPDYVVTVEERIYVAAEPAGNGSVGVRIPDVTVSASATSEPAAAPMAAPDTQAVAVAVRLPTAEVVRERYLTVRQVSSRHIVAVIELLSPGNKRVGDTGRAAYLAKRAEILHSAAHLVEIDLLRAGAAMPVIGDAPEGLYRIIVSNNRLWPHVDLYPFGIRDAMPEFVAPLAEGSPGVVVDLNGVMNEIYSARAYNLLIDYQTDPEPPLSDADCAWLDQLLREQGLRKTAN